MPILKPSSLGWVHTILMVLIAINVIGDIGNIVFWWVSPESRALSLNTGYIGVTAGVDNALIAGTVILSVVAVIYIIGLYGLMKRKMWSPLLIIGISIVNRALAVPLYFLSPAFAFWGAWTIVLAVLAYLDWRKMKTVLLKPFPNI